MTTREYYMRNREKVIASNQAYKEAHREETRVKGREYMRIRRKDPEFIAKQAIYDAEYTRKNPDKVRKLFKAWVARHPEYHVEWHRRKQKVCPEKYMLYAAKIRAKKAGLPFNLVEADIFIPSHCPVLGIELRVSRGKGFDRNSASLDRVIPELGYVRGNVVVISYRANELKKDANFSELARVAMYVRRERMRVERELAG